MKHIIYKHTIVRCQTQWSESFGSGQNVQSHETSLNILCMDNMSQKIQLQLLIL